jgi:hypothetical protein
MRHVIIGLIVLLASVASPGNAPEAQAHAGNNDPLLIHACTKPQGQVRIVPVAEACLPSEQPVHWGGEDRLVALQQAVAALQASVATLQNALLGAQATLACLHMEGTSDLVVEGCNVHVRSGGGATHAAVNGRGNLIIGYNELDGFEFVRTGSHNLVVGPGHTYSSSGGFVAGTFNAVTGRSASVSGGASNTASGSVASVSGGQINTASGLAASVCGGGSNTASGFFASVSGGSENLAGGIGASVSGGDANTARGNYASVSGGRSNMTSAEGASVSGGYMRSATGLDNWSAGSLFEDH